MSTWVAKKKGDIDYWDLLEKGNAEQYRTAFLDKYGDRFAKDLPNDFGVKIGDKIIFYNGYDIPMMTEVIGFDPEDGQAFMLWDCWWASIRLTERFIDKL